MSRLRRAREEWRRRGEGVRKREWTVVMDEREEKERVVAMMVRGRKRLAAMAGVETAMWWRDEFVWERWRGERFGFYL